MMANDDENLLLDLANEIDLLDDDDDGDDDDDDEGEAAYDPVVSGENNNAVPFKDRVVQVRQATGKLPQQQQQPKPKPAPPPPVATRLLPGPGKKKPNLFGLKKEDEDEKIEHYSGLHIKTDERTMSNFDVRVGMNEKQFIRLPDVASQAKGVDKLSYPWGTVVVVLKKSDARTSEKGEKYGIWTVTDLAKQGSSTTVSLFLFGECFQKHFCLRIGTVILLLNCGFYQSRDGLALRVTKANEVGVIGMAEHLGFCKGIVKATLQPCLKPINTLQSEYCDFHVISAFSQAHAKRPELNSHPQATPKVIEHNLSRPGGTAVFDGRVFSVDVSRQGSMFYHDRHQAKQRHKELVKNGEKPPENELQKQLLEVALGSKKGAGMYVRVVKENQLKGPVAQQAVGKSAVETTAPNDPKLRNSIPRRILAPPPLPLPSNSRNNTDGNNGIKTTAPKSTPPPQADQYLDLDDILNDGKNSSIVDAANAKAIAAVRRMGGIKPRDPNALKRTIDSEKFMSDLREQQQRILHSGRTTAPGVDGIMDKDDASSSNNNDNSNGDVKNSMKSAFGELLELAGGADAVMKATSEHDGAVDAQRLKRFKEDCDDLARKESMANQLDAVMERQVDGYYCSNCNNNTERRLSYCMDHGHEISKVKVGKKFFQCLSCKRPTSFLNQTFPTQQCPFCCAIAWTHVSWYIGMGYQSVSEKANNKLLIAGEVENEKELRQMYD